MQSKALLFSFTVIASLLIAPCFAAVPQCEADALAQAKKLLAFHSEGNGQAAVEPHAKVLPSLVNPANKSQRFVVLEVVGYVYKTNYRMRFLFYPAGGECVLMGQEILELSSL